jgi:hypothetical protein
MRRDAPRPWSSPAESAFKMSKSRVPCSKFVRRVIILSILYRGRDYRSFSYRLSIGVEPAPTRRYRGRRRAAGCRVTPPVHFNDAHDSPETGARRERATSSTFHSLTMRYRRIVKFLQQWRISRMTTIGDFKYLKPTNLVVCDAGVAAMSVPSSRDSWLCSASTGDDRKPFTRQKTCTRLGDECRM